mmetsp:Transcript_10295/g.28274  ORF Transcript_10295/g.28274 Transcript_10295/m.28274 type:complete len:206 (+) Transcript_10295:301-918(+)
MADLPAASPPHGCAGSCGSIPPPSEPPPRGVRPCGGRRAPTWCSKVSRASDSSASRASKAKSRASDIFAGSGCAWIHFATFCSRLLSSAVAALTSPRLRASISLAVSPREALTAPTSPDSRSSADASAAESSPCSWRKRSARPSTSSPTRSRPSSHRLELSRCSAVLPSKADDTASIRASTVGAHRFNVSSSTRTVSAFTCMVLR